MQHSTQIPEIEKLQDFHHFAWHCALQDDGHDILTLSKIEGGIPAFPERFLPPSYALEYVVKGTVRGKMNNKLVELTANAGILVLADHVLTEVEVSPDCEFLCNGFHYAICRYVECTYSAGCSDKNVRGPNLAHDGVANADYIAVYQPIAHAYWDEKTTGHNDSCSFDDV